MSLSRDELDYVIWPRYRDVWKTLCGALWRIANPKNADVPSPSWFNEIVEVQMKAALNIVFSVPQSWVILPEPVSGYAVVVYKKPNGAASPISQQKLNLRHHSFDQFNEMAQLVEKTIIKLIRQVIKGASEAGGDIIEMENEDAHVFVFPKSKMAHYLKALGFADEQIPKMLSVDDIESDFLNP